MGHIYAKKKNSFICDSNLTKHSVFYLATVPPAGGGVGAGGLTPAGETHFASAIPSCMCQLCNSFFCRPLCNVCPPLCSDTFFIFLAHHCLASLTPQDSCGPRSAWKVPPGTSRAQRSQGQGGRIPMGQRDREVMKHLLASIWSIRSLLENQEQPL